MHAFLLETKPQLANSEQKVSEDRRLGARSAVNGTASPEAV